MNQSAILLYSILNIHPHQFDSFLYVKHLLLLSILSPLLQVQSNPGLFGGIFIAPSNVLIIRSSVKSPKCDEQSSLNSFEIHSPLSYLLCLWSSALFSNPAS